jgi:hypothetical protein
MAKISIPACRKKINLAFSASPKTAIYQAITTL